MAHSVRIRAPGPGGAAPSAAYANHQIRTARLAQEEAAGYAVFPQFGDFRGVAGIAHIFLGKLKEALGVTHGRVRPAAGGGGRRCRGRRGGEGASGVQPAPAAASRLSVPPRLAPGVSSG